jgi:hypothetical protein
MFYFTYVINCPTYFNSVEEERAESFNQQSTEKNLNITGTPQDQLTPDANRTDSGGISTGPDSSRVKGESIEETNQQLQTLSQEASPIQGDELASLSQAKMLDNNDNNADEENQMNETNVGGLMIHEPANVDEEEEELLVGFEGGDEANAATLDPSLNLDDITADVNLVAVDGDETTTTTTTAAFESEEVTGQKEETLDDTVENIDLDAVAAPTTAQSPSKKKDSNNDKTVTKKRKPKPKRFPDGNLILEEEDDENERAGSPMIQMHQIGDAIDDSEKQELDILIPQSNNIHMASSYFY